VAHYLLNLVGGDAAPTLRERAAGLRRVGMWGVDEEERHRGALAAGDLVLLYLGAPERLFVGHAELASAVHDWTPSEVQAFPGDSAAGVVLTRVEEWDPPVPMQSVLSRIESPAARGDFDAGVVLITADEYETTLAVAARRGGGPGSGQHRLEGDRSACSAATLLRRSDRS
jgi:hypothetical protein